MLIEVDPFFSPSPEPSVIVISDDEEDDKDTPLSEKNDIEPKGSVYHTAQNSPVIERAAINPMSLLADSFENVVSLFQRWRSNNDAEASVNYNKPPVQRPIASRCIKPSKEIRVRRYTPYEKTQASLRRHDLLGKVSDEEMVLIRRDAPGYCNSSMTKFKIRGEIFGKVSMHLNYNSPTLREMSLILENLYNASLSQDLLSIEQETFVFGLINRILHFLETLMLVSGEGSLVPFKPPADFRTARVPKGLPDHYYGDLNELDLHGGSDINRYELFKMIRHFDQITISITKEKVEKYLLMTGTQTKIPLKRTYEEALVEARKREAERIKYKATSCTIEAEKEFAEARKRQAVVEKKEIPKKKERSRSAVVNNNDQRSSKRNNNDPVTVKRPLLRMDTVSGRSHGSNTSSHTRHSSSFRSVSPPPMRSSRRPTIRPDNVFLSSSCLAKAAIIQDKVPVIHQSEYVHHSRQSTRHPVIQSEQSSSSLTVRTIQTENDSSSSRQSTRHPNIQSEQSSSSFTAPTIQTENDNSSSRRSIDSNNIQNENRTEERSIDSNNIQNESRTEHSVDSIKTRAEKKKERSRRPRRRRTRSSTPIFILSGPGSRMSNRPLLQTEKERERHRYY